MKCFLNEQNTSIDFTKQRLPTVHKEIARNDDSENDLDPIYPEIYLLEEMLDVQDKSTSRSVV